MQPICSTGDWWQNFAPINPLRKVKTVVRNSIVRKKLSATMTIVIKAPFLTNIFLHKVSNIYILYFESSYHDVMILIFTLLFLYEQKKSEKEKMRIILQKRIIRKNVNEKDVADGVIQIIKCRYQK